MLAEKNNFSSNTVLQRVNQFLNVKIRNPEKIK